MENRPEIKGRGAALLQALQRHKAAEGPTTQTTPAAPRGRAAMLQKLAELKISSSRVGAETSTSSAVVTTVPQTEVTATASSEPCLYRGSSGTQVRASCNYIRIVAEGNRGVFEYRVSFKPEIDSKSIRSRMIYSHLGAVKMFDGGSILYLPDRLPDKSDYTCTHPHDKSEFTMTVTYVKQKLLGECLHLFNILFKRIMRALLLSPVGRNYFDPHRPYLIPQHKLEILPGYAVAVEEYEGGVMICLDTQHRVMRTQNVYDVLVELRCTARERFQEMATKHILGSVVMTKYNNRAYRIDQIMWQDNPECTFKTQDEREISYVQYYRSQYGIEIQDTRQPLLLHHHAVKQSGSAEKVDKMICLIPELCFLTGLTDEMRADFKVMKDVAMYTRVTPNQRMGALRQYCENIQNSSAAKKILEEWGLRLDNNTVDLLARVLQPEALLFGNGIQGHSEKADWNNLAARNKVLGPVDLRKWYLFYTNRDERVAREFVDHLIRLGGPLGMRIDKPRVHALKDDRTDTYVHTLRNLPIEEAQILVFVFPTMRDERYSAIKRICSAEMAVPTQVVMARTLSNPKKVRTIVMKIAMQMNCKMGGSLWSVRFPFNTWMICGIDVYHSTSNKQSVCAFVASINNTLTRWYSVPVFQGQELGDQYKMCLAKSLEKHREISGVFPTNVVIFRDGVGNGQLRHCKEYEVAQFEKCLADYGLTSTKLTMVVVQKRINTRIFGHIGNELDNPTPGTIVDNAITMRNWYDFFLVAQHVNQGTVTPTHYIVVHDSAKLKPDHVQKLAYKLCHLYYNWCGTIRVPAPCQYAHKMAYLVGQHIRKEPSPGLCDKLFYL